MNSYQQLHFKRFSRAGFSLVELLVCIVVIAILTAISIPAVGYLRQSANKSKTAAKLHHLVLGTNLYAADNSGLAPAPRVYRDGTLSYNHAPHYYMVEAYDITLREYVGDRFEALYAPGPLSEDPEGSYDPDVQRAAADPNDFVTFQYFNADASGDNTGRPTAENSLLFKRIIDSPANHAMWGTLTYVTGGRSFGQMEGRSNLRELEGMSAAFPDGSVRWVEFDKLVPFSADGAYLWPDPEYQKK
ncbi:MAG: type II secretion system protein [Puniceicoccales bacterium]